MANIKSLVSPSADTGADKIFGANWNDFVKSYQRALPYKAIVGISGSTVYSNDNNGNQLDSGTAGTDDARVIQTALNLGGLVYLTARTFVLSAALSMPDNTALVGSGLGITKLTSTGSHNMIQNSNVGYVGSNTNIIISDLEIDATGNNNSVGILMQWVYGLLIKNVYSHNTSNSNFELDSCKNVTVNNCRVANAVGPSSGRGIAFTGCEQFKASDCVAENNYGYGFDCESDSHAKLGHIQCLNGVLNNCVCVGTTTEGGFIFSDNDNVIANNCIAYNCKQHGFYITGTTTQNNMLIGCKAKNCSQQGSNLYDGFTVDTAGNGGMIIGCIADGTLHKYGFEIKAGASNFDLLNCKSYNHVTAASANAGTNCTYLDIEGNKMLGQNAIWLDNLYKVAVGNAVGGGEQLISAWSNTQSAIAAYTFSTGTGSEIRAIGARGTIAAPAAPANGDTVGSFSAFAYNGTSYVITARARSVINTSASQTKFGTDLIIETGSDLATPVMQEVARADTKKNFSVGTAQLVAAATDGFFYIPTINGTPSGVPTSKTGLVPMAYDSTNNQFYIYNGAWKKVALT